MDSDKLILLIKEQCLLWDKSDNQYKDSMAREKCWLDVAEGLVENWNELPPSEKNNHLTEIKSKWKNIRDNYMRSLNPVKSDQPSRKKKRKYIFADALAFLKNSKGKRSTNGSIDTTTSIPLTSASSIFAASTFVSSTSAPSASTSSTSVFSELPTAITFNQPETSETFTKNSKKVAPVTSFQTELLKKLETSSDDADRHYLLSLLPFYKAFSDIEKLQFQQHVLNFMLLLKEGNIAPQQPCPYPNSTFPAAVNHTQQTTSHYPPTSPSEASSHDDTALLPFVLSPASESNQE